MALSKQLLHNLASNTKHHSLSFNLFPFPHLLQIPLLFACLPGEEAHVINNPTSSVALNCGNKDLSASFLFWWSSSFYDSLSVLNVTMVAFFPPVVPIGFCWGFDSWNGNSELKPWFAPSNSNHSLSFCKLSYNFGLEEDVVLLLCGSFTLVPFLTRLKRNSFWATVIGTIMKEMSKIEREVTIEEVWMELIWTGSTLGRPS